MREAPAPGGPVRSGRGEQRGTQADLGRLRRQPPHRALPDQLQARRQRATVSRRQAQAELVRVVRAKGHPEAQLDEQACQRGAGRRRALSRPGSGRAYVEREDDRVRFQGAIDEVGDIRLP